MLGSNRVGNHTSALGFDQDGLSEVDQKLSYSARSLDLVRRKLGRDGGATEGKLNEGARSGQVVDLYMSRARGAAWSDESTRLLRAEVLGTHAENKLALLRKPLHSALVE